MATVDKKLLGLLNGIAKREYYDEIEITNEFLNQELYPDMEKAMFDEFSQKFESIIRIIANSDMDFKQLEAFLSSQMQRKEKALQEEQAAAVFRFWKNHKNKIHNVLVERSVFGNKLKQSSWRIDYKTHGRDVQQLHSPVAIYELEIEQEKNKTEKILFEMNAEQLEETLNKFQKIKDKIMLLANN